MKKYEYKTEKIYFIHSDRDEKDMLNNNGKDGWELTSVIKIEETGVTYYYFKRELINL